MVETNTAYPDTATYNTLINACARSEQHELAFGLMREMQNMELQPDLCTYNALMDVYAKSSLIDRAWALLRQMQARVEQCMMCAMSRPHPFSNISHAHDTVRCGIETCRSQRTYTHKPGNAHLTFERTCGFVPHGTKNVNSWHLPPYAICFHLCGPCAPEPPPSLWPFLQRLQARKITGNYVMSGIRRLSVGTKL